MQAVFVGHRIRFVERNSFWRVDAKADYGLLDELASNRINMRLVAEHWDDLLRSHGGLPKPGTVSTTSPGRCAPGNA